MRQAHYAAGDQVNQAQGKLYEASAEVGRLEGEIRFVVEGRQRVEQRLVAAARADRAVGAAAATMPRPRSRPWPARASTPRSRPNCWPPSSKSTTRACPSWKTRSARPGRGQRASAPRWCRCSSRSRCWPPTSATSRTRAASSRCARERLRTDQNGARRARRGAPARAAGAARRRAGGAAESPMRACRSCRKPCRSSTTTAARGSRPSTPKAARHADLSARLDALEALQEKVKTDGKLAPWLAKHGLESLQGLWSRIHIELGWETALESALRERLGALEVSRLDMVRAFATDAPPAKLAFYSPPLAGLPPGASHAAAPVGPAAPGRRRPAGAAGRLAARLLHGRHLEEALAAARPAAARRGHLHPRAAMRSRRTACSFYAPDSEQAGLLARQQEMENLERQLRAQTLIADESRTALARAEAAYGDAAQRLVGGARARRPRPSRGARAAGRDAAAVATGRADPRPQRTAAPTWAKSTAQLEELQERRAAAEARFEELDMQLADSQERHAQLDETVIEAGRALADAASSTRSWSAQAQEATFAAAHARSAPRRTEPRDRDRQPAGRALTSETSARPTPTRPPVRRGRPGRAAGRAGAQARARSALAPRAASTTTSRSSCAPATSARLQLERELDPLRQRITDFQLKEQAARLGFEQYQQLLADARAPTWKRSRCDRDRQGQARRPAGRDRPADNAKWPRSARSTWRRSTNWPSPASARPSSTPSRPT